MQFSPSDFYYFGSDTTSLGKIQVQNPARVYVGNYGLFNERIELSVADIYNPEYKYNLKLSDWVFLNSSIKIEAVNYVELGKSVIVGPFVFISDVAHEYQNFRAPIKFQGIANAYTNRVVIRDGAWLGAGARVLGNLTVGYGAVVGANSVVTKSIPDHAVAVGAPAQVIKICDYRNGEWIDVRGRPDVLQQIIARRGVFAGYNLGLLSSDAMAILVKQTGTPAEEKEKSLEFINALLKAWSNFNTLIKHEEDCASIFRENLLYLEAFQRKIYSDWETLELNKAKTVDYFQYIQESLAMILNSYSAQKMDEVQDFTETRLCPALLLLRNYIDNPAT